MSTTKEEGKTDKSQIERERERAREKGEDKVSAKLFADFLQALKVDISRIPYQIKMISGKNQRSISYL